MLATSTEAEEDTPLPSGTAEETCVFVHNKLKSFNIDSGLDITIEAQTAKMIS